MGFLNDKWDYVKDLLSFRTEHRVGDIQTLHRVNLSVNVGTKDDHKQSVNAVLDALSIFIITLAFLCCSAGAYLLVLTLQLLLFGTSGFITTLFLFVPPSVQYVIKLVLYAFALIGTFKVSGVIVRFFKNNEIPIKAEVVITKDSKEG